MDPVPVVVDAGSNLLKAGFAVPEKPPSMVNSFSGFLFLFSALCCLLSSEVVTV